MPVHVLQRDGWIHIQTPDNYIAWVHRVGVHLVNEAEMAAWNNAEKIVVTAHYGFVYSKPDRTSQTISDVVAGNRFKWDGRGSIKVIYPDGRQGYISKSIAMPEKEMALRLETGCSRYYPHCTHNDRNTFIFGRGLHRKGWIAADSCVLYFLCTTSLSRVTLPQQAYVGEHIDIASDFFPICSRAI